jgi:hypothetical protein
MLLHNDYAPFIKFPEVFHNQVLLYFAEAGNRGISGLKQCPILDLRYAVIVLIPFSVSSFWTTGVIQYKKYF